MPRISTINVWFCACAFCDHDAIFSPRTKVQRRIRKTNNTDSHAYEHACRTGEESAWSLYHKKLAIFWGVGWQPSWISIGKHRLRQSVHEKFVEKNVRISLASTPLLVVSMPASKPQVHTLNEACCYCCCCCSHSSSSSSFSSSSSSIALIWSSRVTGRYKPIFYLSIYLSIYQSSSSSSSPHHHPDK